MTGPVPRPQGLPDEGRAQGLPDEARAQGLPDEAHAHAAAVAAVGASPAVLRRLLAGMTAQQAWRRLVDGTHAADPAGRHRRRAAAHPPAAVAEACARCGARVLCPGDPGYPAFLDRREQPAVLFALGAAGDAGHRLRVAVVGTRSPSASGAGTAWQLGRALAEAGVVVVSGLARGIDTAAHRGALAAAGPPVVGVLGAAPDAPVAADAGDLRRRVAEGGLLLSEVPPGMPTTRWMFAVRNRVMAAAAHVVVVVESHAEGGSLHTVDAARRLGVTVAVPAAGAGLPASTGTRALLERGLATGVASPSDVVGLARTAASRRPTVQGRLWPIRPPGGAGADGLLPPEADRVARALGPVAAAVARALGPVPVDVAAVAVRAGLPVGVVALALHQLCAAGLAAEEHGWWARG